MVTEEESAFETSDLRICPQTGQVTSAQGRTLRLAPVNMKVLEVLLHNSGRVVSRIELFDAVWGNQVVGEDALTRCISDIRAELRKLSECGELIETLPRRGYRWTQGVRKATPSPHPPATQHPVNTNSNANVHNTSGLVRLIGRGAGYLIALVMMASAIVWAMDRLSQPQVSIVAVLPISASASERDLARRLDIELSEHLMPLDQIDVLARSAVDSRPANPFPFFYFQFGARWVIETELRSLPGEQRALTVALVDARSGIVLMQTTQALTDDATKLHIAAAVERLSAAITAELGR